MVETTSSFSCALHAHQFVVAKQVERFFRGLTRNSRLRRGVFRGVEELIMAIGEYIDRHNQNPKPFIWTAKASDVLRKSETRQEIPE